MVSKYRNDGQTCVCANPLYVQDGVYDAIVAKLAEKANTSKLGNGSDAGVTQAPMIDEPDEPALAKIEQHGPTRMPRARPCWPEVRASANASTRRWCSPPPTCFDNLLGMNGSF